MGRVEGLWPWSRPGRRRREEGEPGGMSDGNDQIHQIIEIIWPPSELVDLLDEVLEWEWRIQLD